MKILILKTSSLGDIIQTFPVLSYLKEKLHASVDWVVEKPFAELLSSNPLVDKIFLCDTKKWRTFSFSNFPQIADFRKEIRKKEYDVVFDLQGNVKSGLILTQIKAKKKVGFGLKSVHEWPNALFTSQRINPEKGLNIREDYLAVVKGFFKDEAPFNPEAVVLDISPEKKHEVDCLVSKNSVLICPGAAWPNKRLPFDSLLSFISGLKKARYLLAWGTDKEREFCENLSKKLSSAHVLPRFSIPQLQYAMSISELVIAMDSLPLHLCATTKTPTISFFGPTSAQKFRPIGKEHLYFQGSCPYNISFEKTCPKLRTCETGACMKKMSFEKV